MTARDRSTALELQILTLARIDSYLALANVKASLLVPTAALVLGIAVSSFFDLPTAAGFNAAMARACLGASVVLTSASAAAALFVVFAFLGSGGLPGTYHSLLFFGAIKDQALEVYIERVASATDKDFEEDLARQIHVLSGALSKKYVWVNSSIVLLGLSALPTAGLILIRVAGTTNG